MQEGFLAGQLLRPSFAASAARPARFSELGDEFWLAALSVQLAHEASLLHDDVVDGARFRRGHPTTSALHGVGAALIAGDQLLARAYLAAAATGDMAFVERFARAVDRTIEGERTQGKAVGVRLDEAATRGIARLKSGELFGVALSAAATLQGSPAADRLADLGRDLGMLYQRVDDLLDFCPTSTTGKPPLADHARDLWTWPRSFLPPGAPPHALFKEGSHGEVPALRALVSLEAEGGELLERLEVELPHAREVRSGVRRWLESARAAVRREMQAEGPVLPASASRSREDAEELLAQHGRSFHFAARLMPPEFRAPVTHVYAFCRMVDDAVDRAPNPVEGGRRLDALERAAYRAYHEGDPAGPERTGGVVGRAMADMRAAEVSFSLAEELMEGVRMDLRSCTYADMEALRLYTHRVAGVVGLWIAGLGEVRDPWALSLADELGHSMQLTNIARDVGVDLMLGRVYLPDDLLDRHGLSREHLVRILRGTTAVPSSFAALLEELMGMADSGYGAAFQALPRLPAGYRRAMAVAARVYQGIHREIRRNGYDTLRRRARTGPVGKGVLAISALRELAKAEARPGA